MAKKATQNKQQTATTAKRPGRPSTSSVVQRLESKFDQLIAALLGKHNIVTPASAAETVEAPEPAPKKVSKVLTLEDQFQTLFKEAATEKAHKVVKRTPRTTSQRAATRLQRRMLAETRKVAEIKDVLYNGKQGTQLLLPLFDKQFFGPLKAAFAAFGVKWGREAQCFYVQKDSPHYNRAVECMRIVRDAYLAGGIVRVFQVMRLTPAA